MKPPATAPRRSIGICRNEKRGRSPRPPRPRARHLDRRTPRPYRGSGSFSGQCPPIRASGWYGAQCPPIGVHPWVGQTVGNPAILRNRRPTEMFDPCQPPEIGFMQIIGAVHICPDFRPHDPNCASLHLPTGAGEYRQMDRLPCWLPIIRLGE